MGYLVGIVLAIGISAGARFVRLDRDRAFYPTIVIVVATYYVLFAVMAGSPRTLVTELVGVAVFIALAIAGFRVSLWFAVIGLIGHGVFDFFRPMMGIVNAGVPPWWPPFCIGYDVVAGVILAILLRMEASTGQAVKR